MVAAAQVQRTLGDAALVMQLGVRHTWSERADLLRVLGQVTGQQQAVIQRQARCDVPGQVEDDRGAVAGQRVVEAGLGIQFAGLRDVQPGDEIQIEREDGSTATFAVDYGEAYPKDDFATDKVYGNTDDSQLRLITCDGYDPATGNFGDNYVVYATLIT